MSGGGRGHRVEGGGEVGGEATHARASATIGQRSSAFLATNKEAHVLVLLMLVAALQVFTLILVITIAGRTERLEKTLAESRPQ